MVRRDARRLPEAALEDLRRRAVAAVESGRSRSDVARLFGVSRKTVGNWVTAYRDLGEDAFRPRTRGRRPGEQLALAPGQQAAVLEAVTGRIPEELELPYRVWTRQAVAELVNREFRITLSLKTVSGYLARWGLLPAPANVLEALRGSGPAGHRSAEGVWLTWHRTPAGLDVLLAACYRGSLYFDVRTAPFEAAAVTDFLRRLADQLDRPIGVVVRRWPAGQTGLVRTWPGAPDPRITVRFAH
ncbi:helix-turn-helix domain-containing protein [Amycolatopsis balhimycina DSM 5908]|uniref:Helix-turn-helix domain-containing protein n=1 Tax=Amycolatopsis balhimycina DSM 5908 TaxID=1081091 RepID=A0A428X690_AMYBA|nr:helix-turn-helix domain-containing protein [Amycolatopsis balhimycina]RSM50777.1 helix-turn-helix domain-containing protein [Amycolatopsis balhimycina DSM 5908]